MIKLALAGGAIAAIALLYWQNLNAADSAGYQRCVAEARESLDRVNRDVTGVNAAAESRVIEQEGRLKVLSVDALTGVKNIPQCAVSECALEDRFVSKLKEIRK